MFDGFLFNVKARLFNVSVFPCWDPYEANIIFDLKCINNIELRHFLTLTHEYPQLLIQVQYTLLCVSLTLECSGKVCHTSYISGRLKPHVFYNCDSSPMI